jgi:gliding motility-associated-like protein
MNIKLLIAFLLGTFLLFQKDAFSQGFCGNTGGFTVNPSQGCAPLTVTIKNQVAKAENISYAYNFNRTQTTVPDIKETTQDSSHTYTLAGTYTILQFGSAGGTGFSQCKDVKVLETRAPTANVTVCKSGKVQLDMVLDSISEAYDFIEINWGDGTQVWNWDKGKGSVFHNYAGAGPWPPVKLTGKYTNGQCAQSTSTSTISSKSSQSLASVRIRNVEMLSSGDVKLIYEGMDGIPTEVLIDKGDGQFVSTGKKGQSAGPQAVTVNGLNPQQIYRFKLSSKDICDDMIESPIVSSLIIKEGSFSLDEIISVAWEHYPNTDQLIEYQLKRDGAVVFTSSDQLSYLDKDVKCGNTYKYEIVAIIENDVRSYSSFINIEPKSSAPGVINTASVTVEDDNTITTKVEVSGEGLTSTYNLIVERALLGATDFQPISPADNQTLRFQDTNVNTAENSYCYRFAYENACKLKSPDYNTPVCSILVKTNTPEIAWNADAPFTDAVGSYDLLQMDDKGNIQDAIPKQLSTSHTLDLSSQSAFSFRVKASSGNGNFTSFSNILNFRSEAIILVPDAFTPNGDAYNERFEVKGYFISDFKMSVFNRWGEVVFQSNSIAEGWDGRIKEEKAPGGYYLYKIEASASSGDKVVKNGSFLLIR